MDFAGQVGAGPEPSASSPEGRLRIAANGQPSRGGPGPSVADRLRSYSRTAGAAAAVVGLLVFVGWALDVEALKGPIPGLITMKANTALGFVLMGISLLLLAQDGIGRTPRLVVKACASLAATVGGLSLAQYVLGQNLGIDELLFEDPAGAMTVHPGRLAPQTAIEFVLLGVALLMLDSESRLGRGLVQGFAVTSAVLSLFALLGYVYGIDQLSTVAAFSPMALHTALTSLVLSCGVLCARADRGVANTLASPSTGGIMARRLIPAAIVVIPALGWIRLQGEQMGLYEVAGGVALFAMALLVVLGVVIMVTARALDRADAARRQGAVAQRQLAAIVESSEEAILSKTPTGLITSWNRGAQSLYGYAPEEIIGEPVGTLMPPERAEEEALLLEQVLAGKRLEHYETQRVRKDGTRLDVSLTLSPVKAEDGTIVGAAAIARDMTERNGAARALEEAKEDAERANRAKSEFLSRMSHELRTPLNAILGFGQLLEMDGLEPRQNSNAHQIVKAGRHLLDLINEVLEISRIEAGNMEVSLEPVHLGTLVPEVLDLVAPLAEERGLELVTVPAETCDLYVHADNQRLKQVLLNLLSNAVKYNRPGGRVSVSCEPAPDHRVRLRVSDTGAGIAVEQLSKLFTPFERLGAESGSEEGTGLGLALSKRLVEAMGGTLAVDSDPGVGTAFAVEVPRAEALDGGRDQAQEGVDGVLVGGCRGGSSNVLYIEDNVSNFKLVEQILERRPEVKLLAAMDGDLGLNLARQHLPDLILLDLHLPGLPGEQVLAELQADARTRDIPVVMLSADATKGQVERLLSAGARDYLTKPLDVRRFIDVMEENLTGSGVCGV